MHVFLLVVDRLQYLIKGCYMNILITLYYKAELGGLHDNVFASAVEAKNRGHNVVVACRSGIFNDKLLDAGIKTITTNLDEYTEAMDEIKTVMGKNIDLIHCHPGSSRVVAMRLNKELNVPVIYHVHGGWVDNINFYIDRVESVFAVSESVKKKIVEKCYGYEYKVHVIPNYSDYDYSEITLYDNNSDVKIISLITRLDNDKKLIMDEVKKLTPYLNTITIPIRLRIVGDGVLKDEFISFLENNITNSVVQVEYVGWVAEWKKLKQLIQESFIVIGPGRVAIDSYTLGSQVIVVGSQNYQGIISKRNWQLFVSNNFGGYGENLEESNIVKDFDVLLNNPKIYNSSLRIGQEVIKTFFDKETTLKKHFNIYNIIESYNN